MTPGRLFLIPVPLGASPVPEVLPAAVIGRARVLKHFVAENAKSARAFLKSLPTDTPLQQIDIRELNEHTPSGALSELLSPLLAGHDTGLISEAGCPAVADPGAALVALAHASGITVTPLVGPSSLLLALMGSQARTSPSTVIFRRKRISDARESSNLKGIRARNGARNCSSRRPIATAR